MLVEEALRVFGYEGGLGKEEQAVSMAEFLGAILNLLYFRLQELGVQPLSTSIAAVHILGFASENPLPLFDDVQLLE